MPKGWQTSCTVLSHHLWRLRDCQPDVVSFCSIVSGDRRLRHYKPYTVSFSSIVSGDRRLRRLRDGKPLALSSPIVSGDSRLIDCQPDAVSFSSITGDRRLRDCKPRAVSFCCIISGDLGMASLIQYPSLTSSQETWGL